MSGTELTPVQRESYGFRPAYVLERDSLQRAHSARLDGSSRKQELHLLAAGVEDHPAALCEELPRLLAPESVQLPSGQLSGLGVFLSIQRHDGHGFLTQNSKSEEHTSELQSLMRISYAVFC